MKQWEIWTFDFTAEDTHPVVILSNNSRIASPDLERVNVLLPSNCGWVDDASRQRNRNQHAHVS